jgi:hypothetical protein
MIIITVLRHAFGCVLLLHRVKNQWRIVIYNGNVFYSKHVLRSNAMMVPWVAVVALHLSVPPASQRQRLDTLLVKVTPTINLIESMQNKKGAVVL